MKKHYLIALLLLLCSFSYGQKNTSDPILVIDPQGHAGVIRDVLFTPNRKVLVSVSEDKTIRLWDTASGDLLHTLRGEIGEGKEGKLNAAALSAGGKMLAVGGYLPNNEIRIINLLTSQQIATLTGHQNIISDIAFSPDNRYIATASGDKTVKIWYMPVLSGNTFPENDKPRHILTLEGHEAAVYGLAFAPNGRQLATVSLDGTLRLWQLSADMSKVVPTKIISQHEDKVVCVDYSADGKYIVSGGYDGKIFMWNAEGELEMMVDDLAPEKIYSLAFSPDSKKLVALSKGGKGGIYEADALWTKTSTFTQHDNTVTTAHFAPRKSSKAVEAVATAGGENGEIFIWDANSTKVYTHILGKGRAALAASFGDGLQVGVGSSRPQQQEEDPFQYTFDFETLKLHLSHPNAESFSPSLLVHGNEKLRRGKTLYDLRVGAKTTITNDPQKDKIIRSFTFTPTGKVVVGSGAALKLYTKTGTFIREFVGHTGEVWAVSVSKDGTKLISASGDQTFKLWNIETGELLATLFISSDKEWVCWTPKGYYNASAGGEKYIGWQINKGAEQMAEYYPLQTFRKKYLQPDLVKLTIEKGNFSEAMEAFNRTHELEIHAYDNINSNMPPQIQWVTPVSFFTELDDNIARIKAIVRSDTKIESVRVLVDGRNVFGKRGFKISTKDTDTYKYLELEVPLVNKESKIQIYAENIRASIVSEERIFKYNKELEVLDEELEFDVAELATNYLEEPDLYVLSVGVSDYEHSPYNLNYADDDARAMSQLYKGQKGKLYKEVYVKELIDREATKSGILQGFSWLEQNVKQKDIVIIFVASHGFNEDEKFYLLPHDGNPQDLSLTAVNWDDFAETLSNLPSKVIMFLDACNSGQLGIEIQEKRNNTEALRSIASEKNGIVIMAGSTGDESSYEDPKWEHGAFTMALLEGLQEGKADVSEDEIIYLRELDFYVAERVNELTKDQQHPTTQKPSTISRLPILSLK